MTNPNPLDQLRAQLKEQEAAMNGGGNRRSGGDNALFPFWNAKDGTTTTIRFLPDGDSSNIFFWKERRVVNLSFDGVLGDDTQNGKTINVQVPCVKMYDKTLHCPILAEINTYWKTELEETARRYWPKRSYLMQGFVRDLPEFKAGKEDNAPENPIRRFTINKNLFKNIHQGVLDPEMENMPTDYQNGTDFRIIKTQQGEYANYSTSMFARRESPLTEDELRAVEEYGLNRLEDFLPKRPSDDAMAVIEAMFYASLNGQPYNPEWAEFYRPFGMNFDNYRSSSAPKPSAPAPQPQSTPAQQAAPAPQPAAAPETPAPQPEPQAPEGGGSEADDVLAQLRARINGG